MVKHFEGPVEETMKLWEKAMGFGVDCYQLEEKILVYSMFTRCYPDKGLSVLKEYICQGGREQVILAYLTFEAYGYFIGDRQRDSFLFEALEKIMEKGFRLKRKPFVLYVCLSGIISLGKNGIG